MMEEQLKQVAAREAEEAEEEAGEREDREGFEQWWVAGAGVLGALCVD